MFVRNQVSGVVHVSLPPAQLALWRSQYQDFCSSLTDPVLVEIAQGSLSMVGITVPCCCGHVAFQPDTSSIDNYVTAFPDSWLCWSCRAAYPGDSSLLFEHPVR